MIEPAALATLYRDHRETLDTLVALENRLKARFFGLDLAVEGMMLAAMTGEALLLIGPPGTAKSRLVRSFCNLLRLVDDDALAPAGTTSGAEHKNRQYFEYLLTQFTEPSELFGFYDLPRLFGEPRALVRDSTNMMQEAQVVFLDEVFNASSAILNALLTFMNERRFHDRGRVVATPLQLLFAATNHPPREDGLAAVYDRFLLRVRVDNVSSGYRLPVGRLRDGLAGLMAAAWAETHDSPRGSEDARFAGLLPRMQAWRAAVDGLTHDGRLRIDQASPLFARLADLVVGLRQRELSEMSNRRLVKFAGVVLAQALLRAARAKSGAPVVEPRDLTVILDYGLDAEDDGAVAALRQNLVGP